MNDEEAYLAGRRDALREATEALITKGRESRNGTRAKADYIRGALVVQGLYFRAVDDTKQQLKQRNR